MLSRLSLSKKTMIRKLQHLVEQSSVLVVDDSIEALKIIGELLKKEFAIKVTTNGETALKIAQFHI